MVLKNGIVLLFQQNTNYSKTFKCVDGTNSSTLTPTNLPTSISNATYGLNIMFGTGTTLPTKDDYTLENPLDISITTSVISRVNTAVNITYGDVPSLAFVTALITNETSDNVTITEVGMYFTFPQSSSGKKILLTRTVLDEPLVMESGKTYQITVAIN